MLEGSQCWITRQVTWHWWGGRPPEVAAEEQGSRGQVMMMTWGLTCPDFIFRLHHQFNSVWWSRKKPTQQLFIVDIFFSDLKRKTLIISTHSWWLETKLEEWCDQESEQLEEAPGPRLLVPPHLRSLCDQWCVKSVLSQGDVSSIINIERYVKECIVCRHTTISLSHESEKYEKVSLKFF